MATGQLYLCQNQLFDDVLRIPVAFAVQRYDSANEQSGLQLGCQRADEKLANGIAARVARRRRVGSKALAIGLSTAQEKAQSFPQTTSREDDIS